MGQVFSEKDKELLETFKKINSSGLKQLNVFINKLSSDGADIDEFSVIYYTYQLFNGPLSKHAREITKNRTIPNFKLNPDILGVNSNTYKSNSSTPVFAEVAVNANFETFNKCPAFIQASLQANTRSTSIVFNFNFESSVYNDNTYPYINKNPKTRVKDEYGRGYDNVAQGNYMVKDVEFFHTAKNITLDILLSVRDFLGKPDYRLYLFKKFMNYFNPKNNTPVSTNDPVIRLLSFMVQEFDKEGHEKMTTKCTPIETDMFGNSIESIKNKQFELKTDQGKFKLYTVKGQLGSGGDPVVSPITEEGEYIPKFATGEDSEEDIDTGLTADTDIVPSELTTPKPPESPEQALCEEDCDKDNLQY